MEGFDFSEAHSVLGVGVLTWFGDERRSDRYGTVWLMEDGHTSLSDGDARSMLDAAAVRALIGENGTLVAEVISARESTHIGDFARGIFPQVPEVGANIVLGRGTLFHSGREAILCVGVMPYDQRETDWLDPVQLYWAHEQLVTLKFYPEASE
jgi:hypothetical protein